MSLPIHRRGGGARWGVALVLVGLAVASAHAQESSPLPNFSLERLELNPGRGPVVLSGAELLSARELRVVLVGHYQRKPLSVYSEGQRLSLVKDRATAVLALAYGVLPWLELGAGLPVVALQQGDDLTAQGISSPSSSGVGSPWLQGRLGLLSEASEDLVDVALKVGVGLPVGSTSVLAREAGTSVGAQVMVGKRLGLVAPVLEAGVLLRPSVALGDASGSQDEVGNELRVGAGVTTVTSPLRGELGLRATFSQGRTTATVEALAGARYAPVPTMEVFAVGGMGFGQEPGTPQFRVLIGLAFTLAPDPPPEPEIIYEFVTPVRPRRPEAPSEEEEADSEASPPESSAPSSAPPAPSRLASPEADTDGDGVVDVLDACVRERGSPEHHGCAADMPQLVTLTRERLVLNGQVFFETGSATAPENSRVLDRAAQVLQEHPEIPLVVIEGHTDAVGGPDYNQALSKERAEAVRRYLIERGVPADRLRARGFGAARPVDTNATEQGRESNRRVEVHLRLGNPTAVMTSEPPR
ncbi:OmpA family protein [Hyalangium rubrum]|uniref:OmpA family protein n=1 Tax=Hyalangium rubrum TaxID=3103134 RepID=A0ABU5HFW0_9BACT|nr:OmpA family protein [Hyalangium sp. s54d21]MDY7232352.1 OmpA family protein [Hyalangium sp. s54d21]